MAAKLEESERRPLLALDEEREELLVIAIDEGEGSNCGGA